MSPNARYDQQNDVSGGDTQGNSQDSLSSRATVRMHMHRY